MRDLPLLLGAVDVAQLLDSERDPWDTQRARRWLKSTTAGKKRGGRWVTTVEQLRRHFPEALPAGASEEDEPHTCVGCLKLGDKLRAAQDQVRVLADRLAKRAA